MLDRREGLLQRLAFFLGVEELQEGARVVDRGESVDLGLCLRVERLIGRDRVGEDRVAAEGGRDALDQDRGGRRLSAKGRVGVPVAVAGLAVAAGQALLEFFRNERKDLRIVGQREDRMLLEIAECGAECDMLFSGQILVAEEDDTIFESVARSAS